MWGDRERNGIILRHYAGNFIWCARVYLKFYFLKLYLKQNQELVNYILFRFFVRSGMELLFLRMSGALKLRMLLIFYGKCCIFNTWIFGINQLFRKELIKFFHFTNIGDYWSELNQKCVDLKVFKSGIKKALLKLLGLINNL